MQGHMSDAESYARPLAIEVVMPWRSRGQGVGVGGREVCDRWHRIQPGEGRAGASLVRPVGRQAAKAQGSYAERFSEGFQGMGQWLKHGKPKYREDVAQGLENAPQAFIRMLQGRNLGKQL